MTGFVETSGLFSGSEIEINSFFGGGGGTKLFCGGGGGGGAVLLKIIHQII